MNAKPENERENNAAWESLEEPLTVYFLNRFKPETVQNNDTFYLVNSHIYIPTGYTTSIS